MAKAALAKTATVSTHHSPRSLDNQLLLAALRAFRRGDFSVRLPIGLVGLDGEIADAFNDVVELSERMTKELKRLGDNVGKEGKLGGQARVKGVAGTWKDLIDNVNMMAANLTNHVRNIAEVTTAVANG